MRSHHTSSSSFSTSFQKLTDRYKGAACGGLPSTFMCPLAVELLEQACSVYPLGWGWWADAAQRQRAQQRVLHPRGTELEGAPGWWWAALLACRVEERHSSSGIYEFSFTVNDQFCPAWQCLPMLPPTFLLFFPLKSKMWFPLVLWDLQNEVVGL